MRIGSNIRYHRESKGWSQDALAANMHGISQSTVSRIENNEQDLMWEQIEAFAQVFEISTDELIRPHQTIINSNYQQGGHSNNYTSLREVLCMIHYDNMGRQKIFEVRNLNVYASPDSSHQRSGRNRCKI